jgi:hypothetical protein
VSAPRQPGQRPAPRWRHTEAGLFTTSAAGGEGPGGREGACAKPQQTRDQMHAHWEVRTAACVGKGEFGRCALGRAGPRTRSPRTGSPSVSLAFAEIDSVCRSAHHSSPHTLIRRTVAGSDRAFGGLSKFDDSPSAAGHRGGERMLGRARRGALGSPIRTTTAHEVRRSV